MSMVLNNLHLLNLYFAVCEHHLKQKQVDSFLVIYCCSDWLWRKCLLLMHWHHVAKVWTSVFGNFAIIRECFGSLWYCFEILIVGNVVLKSYLESLRTPFYMEYDTLDGINRTVTSSIGDSLVIMTSVLPKRWRFHYRN